jgi:hypothetical protein
MAREPREFDLKWEGRACTVHELGALASQQVAVRMLNILGKGMREGMSSGTLSSELEVLALIGVGAVLEQLTEDTAKWLTKTFAAVTLVEAEAGGGEMLELKDVQELAFRGPEGLARWLRWLTFCVETSCGDFFAAAFADLKRLKPVKAPTTTATAAPNPSTASGSPSTSQRSGSITA